MKRILIAIFICLSLAVQSSAGPCMRFLQRGLASGSLTTPDCISATQASNDENWSTSITVAITPSSPDSTSMVIAYVSWVNSGRTISTFTYDGNAMTSVATISNAGGNKHAAMYRYNGSLGSGANNVVCTFDSATESVMTVVQIDGANSSSPIDTTDTEEAGTANPQQITPSMTTTQNNSLVVGGVTTFDDAVTHSVCSGTGQALLTDHAEGGMATINVSHKDHDSAGAISQCYESSLANTVQLAIIAAIKPDGS